MAHPHKGRTQLHEQPCQDYRGNYPINDRYKRFRSSTCAAARKEAESKEETFTELEKRNEKQTPENRRTSGLHSAYRTYQEANDMGKKAKKKSSARKPAQLPTMDSTTSTVYRWSMPQVSDRNSCRAAGSIPRNNPAQVCQPHPRP